MKELFWHLEFEIPDMFLRSLKSEQLHFFPHFPWSKTHPSIHPSILTFHKLPAGWGLLKDCCCSLWTYTQCLHPGRPENPGNTNQMNSWGEILAKSKKKKTREADEIWKNRLKQNQQGKYLFDIWVWFYLELFSHVQHFVLIYFDI